MKDYEDEMKKPVTGLVFGNLMTTMLIQVSSCDHVDVFASVCLYMHVSLFCVFYYFYVIPPSVWLFIYYLSIYLSIFQMQKLKVHTESALLTMDQVLASNQLTMAGTAAMPALLFFGRLLITVGSLSVYMCI